MQKLISSLFIVGVKATKQQPVVPTVVQKTEAPLTISHPYQDTLHSSQSSQATSIIVNVPSSESETISVSSEVTLDEGLLSSDEVPSIPSTDVLVLQSQKFPVSVSDATDVSVLQSQELPASNSSSVPQNLENSIDVSIPECLQEAKVAD